jgi:aminocarboxymuconate-semialdehyde decarboxylase
VSAAAFKIDLHTHVLPKEWPDLRARYGYGGFPRLEHYAPCKARMMVDERHFRDVEHNLWDAEARLVDCDRHGVRVQVVSTVPVMFSYWAKPEHADDLARLLNDHLAGFVARAPRRFVGLGTLPMQSPALARRELERCVRQLGLAGVQIGSHVGEWNLDAPEVFEVLATAAELEAMVFVHPWDMLGKERLARYWMPWLVGMPTESTVALCSLIFGGVLERLPKLKICIAHGGGSFFGTLGRIEHGFEARPDLCAVTNPHPPSHYLGRFYVDSLTHDAGMLRQVVDRIGAERVALGTDYPFPLGEDVPGALVESMPELTVAQRDRLLAGTALELIGKTRSDFA